MTASAKTPEGAQIVEVGLGDRSYDIHIGDGVVDTLGDWLTTAAPGRKAAIITDEQVASFHLERITGVLRDSGHYATDIVIPSGESSKSFDQLASVSQAVLEARLERDDILIALGGGVVGDLVGFVAGIVRRGMRFVQVPTSLLAQVDSSVGGKTAINTPQGKNLVGLFNQPMLVLADTELLSTLSDRHLRAGYAELVKYGLLGDAEFFNWLEENKDAVLAGGPARITAIAESCRHKARIVAADETEHGERALLNLGHTFGHALEQATGYSDRLIHGEGVAIGMVLAFAFSSRLNLCSADDAGIVARHLQAVGLPTSVNQIPGDPISVETLMAGIAQDKKVQRGALTFILTRRIGESFVAKDVPASEVQAFLNMTLAD